MTYTLTLTFTVHGDTRSKHFDRLFAHHAVTRAKKVQAAFRADQDFRKTVTLKAKLPKAWREPC